MAAMNDSTLASGWGDYPSSSRGPSSRLTESPRNGVYDSLLERLQQESEKVAKISESERVEPNK